VSRQWQDARVLTTMAAGSVVVPCARQGKAVSVWVQAMVATRSTCALEGEVDSAP